MIKVKNNSKKLYAHTVKNTDKDGNTIAKDYFLKPLSTLDVPEDVAQIWFKTKDIVEFVEPKEAKAEKAALEKENAALKAEIEKLKNETKAADEKVKAKKTDK